VIAEACTAYWAAITGKPQHVIDAEAEAAYEAVLAAHSPSLKSKLKSLLNSDSKSEPENFSNSDSKSEFATVAKSDLPRHRQPRISPPDGLKTAAQAAAKLGCSTKTLDGYVKAGAIGYVIVGHGKKRPRRMFTDADINAFIQAQTRKETPCPSDATHGRRSGNTDFRSTVVSFSALQKRPRDAKPKR
jgi:hypothetical protein